MKATLKFSFWRTVFWILIGLGTWSVGVRIFKGLGAATNLSNQFPWGLWIGFDVLCGVGLAAGGFTIAALVHIFNLDTYRPIVRPAILTAFLGYFLVAVGITLDIGLPWRIWHPLVFWNHNSVMFEVAWCVTLYLTVLALEFLPAVFERFRLKWALKLHHKITIVLVIAGVLLSTLHQSSLGSLYLIVPGKLHPLWYTSLLPYLFFISAVGIGFAMVIVESTLSKRAFGKALEMPLLAKLGQAMVVVLGVYGLLRLFDMFSRKVFRGVEIHSTEALYFSLEMLLLVVIPVGLLVFRRIRETPGGLFAGALSAVLGFVLNRLDVSITGMSRAAGAAYQPSWMEWSVTLGLTALGFGLFALAVKYLPVFEAAGEPRPLIEEERDSAAA
ncbi:MAG: Ni/Fe-hydrogenase cytochrome b subunit [Acidobacteriota bacterium]